MTPAPPPPHPFPVLEFIGDLALYAGSFVAVAFCVFYSLRAHWWRSEAGRFLFILGAYLAILMLGLSAAVSTLLPRTSLAWFIVRIPLYGGAVPLLVWLLSMLARAQRRPGPDRETLRTPLDVDQPDGLSTIEERRPETTSLRKDRP